MKLLLTGGTGFFGRSLLRQLEAMRCSSVQLPFDAITIVTRSPENFRKNYPAFAYLSWIKLHKGDILDMSTLPHNVTYQFLIHAAYDSTESHGLTHLQTYRQIVDGTENMLKFALSSGVKRFLLTSSGAVYGPQPLDMKTVPENYNGMPDPLMPSSSYGIAKRLAEHLCAQYANQYEIETVIARCFAFVGQDLPRDAHYAIGNFIRDALERPEIIVNGNGSPVRSYMHQSDLADWLLKLLQHGVSGNAYNVGSDEEISISNLAFLVRDIVSPEKKVHLKNQHHPENLFRNRYVPDISKAKKQLNLKLTITLDQAIRISVKG
jgi:UDP-glucuronate decarboxylase